MDKIIAIAVILTLILLFLVTGLYFVQKTRFFELCQKYCEDMEYDGWDTGYFGLECKCYSIYPQPSPNRLRTQIRSNALNSSPTFPIHQLINGSTSSR